MTEAAQEKRLCQCGKPMGTHPHSKGSKDNYFCPKCDVVKQGKS